MKRSLNPASPTLRSSNKGAKIRVLLPSSLGKGPPKQETGVGRLRRGRKRRQCSCHHQPGNTGTFENHPHCFLDCPLRDPWLPSDAHREAVLEGLISGHFYFVHLSHNPSEKVLKEKRRDTAQFYCLK